VESLKVPNEVYAPAAGRVSEILASPGQGVEWGQPLVLLLPEEKS
jgi:biotin carboxyl carrier protein